MHNQFRDSKTFDRCIVSTYGELLVIAINGGRRPAHFETNCDIYDLKWKHKPIEFMFQSLLVSVSYHFLWFECPILPVVVGNFHPFWRLSPCRFWSILLVKTWHFGWWICSFCWLTHHFYQWTHHFLLVNQWTHHFGCLSSWRIQGFGWNQCNPPFSRCFNSWLSQLPRRSPSTRAATRRLRCACSTAHMACSLAARELVIQWAMVGNQRICWWGRADEWMMFWF